jgi:hypothetical protein
LINCVQKLLVETLEFFAALAVDTGDRIQNRLERFFFSCSKNKKAAFIDNLSRILSRMKTRGFIRLRSKDVIAVLASINFSHTSLLISQRTLSTRLDVES